MRRTFVVLALSPLLAPLSGMAQDPTAPRTGDFSVYYAYANQKSPYVDPSNPGGNVGGSGVGASGQLNLPYNLFVNGLYQYNNEYIAPEYIPPYQYAGLRQKTEQVRAGGGIQFPMPQQPLVLYAKINYVHYAFDSSSGGIAFGRDNEDGMGYAGGFKTYAGPVTFYLEGSYLDLADFHGQEGFGGVSVPLGPSGRRSGPPELMLEYRWTHLSASERADYSTIFYDYHVGFRLPFGV
jgi:hypothetical protein